MEAFVQLDVCVEIRIGWLEWLVKEGARRVVTGVQVVPWLGVFCAHAQKPPPSRLSLSLSPALLSPPRISYIKDLTSYISLPPPVHDFTSVFHFLLSLMRRTTTQYRQQSWPARWRCWYGEVGGRSGNEGLVARDEPVSLVLFEQTGLPTDGCSHIALATHASIRHDSRSRRWCFHGSHRKIDHIARLQPRQP